MKTKTICVLLTAFLPGPPTAVEVNEVTDSSALLSWERPSQPVDYFEIKLQLKSTSQISYVSWQNIKLE